MFLFRKGIQTPLLRAVCRHHSILKEFSFPKRTFAAAQRQLDFITSEAVDKDQLTPALQQYFKFKEEYKDYVLFFRLGDFYEFFFEDAIKMSSILGIALTTRGKYQNKDIPLCGIPYFTVDNYLKKVIRRGLKVAICEQMETPTEVRKKGKKRKSPVLERSVVRLISAGTLVEDAFLSPRQSNYLCSLSSSPHSSHYGFSVIDISTGEVTVHNIEESQLASLLARYDPHEILLSPSLQSHLPSSLQNFVGITSDSNPTEITESDSMKCVLTILQENQWNDSELLPLVQSHEELSALQQPLQQHLYSQMETQSLAALLQYLNTTQMGLFPRLFLNEETEHAVLEIDRNSRDSLNLTRGYRDTVVGSVLNVLDNTVTVMGSRLLSNRLSSPLTNVDTINSRLSTLSFFYEHSHLIHSIQQQLKQMSDSERSFQRLLLKRGTPQDMGSLRDLMNCCVSLLPIIQDSFTQSNNTELQEMVSLCLSIQQSPVYSLLNEALNENLPLSLSTGSFIREGYLPELEEWKKVLQNNTTLLKELQSKYQQETSNTKLKVKWNDSLGFYIETPSTSPLTDPSLYFPCQLLKGHYRYKTNELTLLDHKRYKANEMIEKIETEMFEKIKEEIEKEGLLIRRLNSLVSVLDVNCSLAVISKQYGYNKPIVDNSSSLHLQNIRHIVIEDMNMKNHSGKTFIPNSISLNYQPSSIRSMIITGPNMGGKTTYLRSVALCVILAQMGCFIPAEDGHIGVIDKVFSRVGSADDIVNNRSTFYSEITETTTILKNATSRSLILIDELGRGTSIEEGVAIAYSVLQYIHNKIQCKTLFATHYREITEIVKKWDGMANYKMTAIPTKNSLLLPYKLEPGVSDQSYGIFIAKMAGIPPEVLMDAEKYLKSREEDTLKKQLQEIDINTITPLQALQFLHDLKQSSTSER